MLLVSGVRDTVPMMVGAAPFGLIYGALAVAHGMPLAAVLGMSLLVFAGSSQFIAVSLIGAGAGIVVIWLTTLVVNLRHALYSATLLPYARSWPLRWRWLLAFGLTDETFAVTEHHFRVHGGLNGHWFQLGSTLAMYLNWLLWTLIGATLGHALPQLGHWGLDFAMLATFSAIVAPQLRRWPYLLAALAAGSVALAARGLPYKLDLMLASLVGVLAGMLAESRGVRA